MKVKRNQCLTITTCILDMSELEQNVKTIARNDNYCLKCITFCSSSSMSNIHDYLS